MIEFDKYRISKISPDSKIKDVDPEDALKSMLFKIQELKAEGKSIKGVCSFMQVDDDVYSFYAGFDNSIQARAAVLYSICG